jgi:hypothetical protein
MPNQYQSEAEIAAVVEGFEKCTTDKAGFTHLSHLTVATYYLVTSTPTEALRKMRIGLLRFLVHHGIGQTKYKERLTQAWMERVQSVIEQMEPDASLVAVTNEVIARLSDSRMTIEDD